MSSWPAIPTSLPRPTPCGSPEAAGIDMNAECSFGDPRVSVRPALQQRRETRDDIKTRGYSAGKYRFGFNGKEEDGETAADAYYFGSRIYGARLGRWLAVDPFFYKYPNQSVSTFCLNSPAIVTDIDGRDIVILIDRDGANRLGHMAILIGKNKDGWTFISKYVYTGSMWNSPAKYTINEFSPIEEFRNSGENFETYENHGSVDGQGNYNVKYKLDDNGEKKQRYDDALYIATPKNMVLQQMRRQKKWQ